MKTIAAVVCLCVAATAAEQLAPDALQFMRAMNDGMKAMDRDMEAAPMSGNIDRDFATMMIPHHAGAIDMAKAELLYGKDPVMRRMAQEILVDQKAEIDAMLLWLNRGGAVNIKRER